MLDSSPSPKPKIRSASGGEGDRRDRAKDFQGRTRDLLGERLEPQHEAQRHARHSGEDQPQAAGDQRLDRRPQQCAVRHDLGTRHDDRALGRENAAPSIAPVTAPICQAAISRAGDDQRNGRDGHLSAPRPKSCREWRIRQEGRILACGDLVARARQSPRRCGARSDRGSSQHDHLVAQVDRFLQVVGDEDHRHALLRHERQQLVLERCARHRVERARRVRPSA